MQDGYTPLMMASMYDRLDVVQILLAYNANTEIVTKVGHAHFLTLSYILIVQDGWTALSFACSEGHFKIAKVLLQHGALPDAHEKVHTCTSMHAPPMPYLF